MSRATRIAAVLFLLLPSCSNENGTGPSDTTPPEAVVLSIVSDEPETATLGWIAPGDDGMEGQASRYDIRYAAGGLNEAGWDSATIVESPPTPRPAGEVDSIVITVLPGGSLYFALRSADEVPNWSALSNVVNTIVSDTTPPAPVTDLAIGSRAVGRVTLTWTAPGDDSANEQASAYYIRYASGPITDATWNDAVRVQGVPAPGPAGSQESFTITDLEQGATYSFALKAADWMNNWSELSNVVSGKSLSVVRLTSSPDGRPASSPDWSPDGQTIAFSAFWSGTSEWRRSQIYLIPASGGEPVQLTDLFAGAESPRWSPDGTRLAIVSYREVYPETWHELSIMEADPGAEPELLVSHGLQDVRAHSWSPDGSRIAYAVRLSRPWDPPEHEIRIVSSAGGESELLLHGNWGIWGLDWSPDGSQLLFASDKGGNRDVWVMPAGGGEPTQLTTDPAQDTYPVWSPDGSQIAFASDRAGNLDIWIMSASGENPIQLTIPPERKTKPSWSPDGGAIAFRTSNADLRNDIWVLSLE